MIVATRRATRTFLIDRVAVQHLKSTPHVQRVSLSDQSYTTSPQHHPLNIHLKMSLRVLSKTTIATHLRPSIAPSVSSFLQLPLPSHGEYKNKECRRLVQHTRRSFASKVSIKIAKEMKAAYSDMENETLLTIAHMGNADARTEVLKRHIMAVDEIEYDQASEICDKIVIDNQGRVPVSTYPYFIGIGAGMIGAFGSLPMVFDLNTALWFNEAWVTTDVPEPRDLETMLEVGSWTWNWMEPPLGTMSFALLCLQFARYVPPSFCVIYGIYGPCWHQSSRP